jgi:hypothetical protein
MEEGSEGSPKIRDGPGRLPGGSAFFAVAWLVEKIPASKGRILALKFPFRSRNEAIRIRLCHG